MFKKEKYVLEVRGIDSDLDKFTMGRISGILMGVTNVIDRDSGYGISEPAKGLLKFYFNGNAFEAKRIERILRGTVSTKDITITIYK